MLAPLEATRRAAGSRVLALLGVACVLSGLVAWSCSFSENAPATRRVPALALYVVPAGRPTVTMPGVQMPAAPAEPMVLEPIAPMRAPTPEMKVPTPGRRDVALGATALFLAPGAASAQRSKLIPRSSAESTASFKAYQLSAPKSQPGEESEAFKAAERKRAAAQAAGTATKDTVADDMKRLGIKTYTEAVGSK